MHRLLFILQKLSTMAGLTAPTKHHHDPWIRHAYIPACPGRPSPAPPGSPRRERPSCRARPAAHHGRRGLHAQQRRGLAVARLSPALGLRVRIDVHAVLRQRRTMDTELCVPSSGEVGRRRVQAQPGLGLRVRINVDAVLRLRSRRHAGTALHPAGETLVSFLGLLLWRCARSTSPLNV